MVFQPGSSAKHANILLLAAPNAPQIDVVNEHACPQVTIAAIDADARVAVLGASTPDMENSTISISANVNSAHMYAKPPGVVPVRLSPCGAGKDRSLQFVDAGGRRAEYPPCPKQ